MELLLINHPLDCPVCDKGGECPLQNQAMSNGNADTRFDDVKRTFPKPIPISSEVLLDRERCVLCARCTRFSQQIAGDPFIELLERGALQQVGITPGEPFDVVLLRQHRADLPGRRTHQHGLPVPGPTVRPGVQPQRVRALRVGLRSAHRPSARKGVAPVGRRRPGGQRGVELRQGPVGVHLRRRSATASPHPMIRERRRHAATRVLVGGRRRSRPPAWRAAAGRAGVLVGGRSTIEDAYAYSKFARIVLGTNDIDFRDPGHSSAEEADFLAARRRRAGR